MTSLKKKYLEHHKDLLEHYTKGNYHNQFLVFKEDFRNELPEKTGWGNDDVLVELIDTEDNNKIYHMGWWLNYENKANDRAFIENWFEIPVFTIFKYIYENKLCACNRKMGASDDGAQVLNDECEGFRFKIRSITFNNCPDLILYSETLDQEELEELLNETTPNTSP